MNSRRRPFRLNRLSLKIALGTAGGAVLLAALTHLLALPIGVFVAVLWIGGAALASYAVAHVVLTARLELARTTLKQIRRHQFDNLEAAHLPRGDELNALVWQVYRTGLALEKEIRELKKIENYRREYLGNVSHELKTPIFAIQGFAETLLDGALEDGRVNRSFLEKVLRNANRLSVLTRDLAEISRLETGDLKMTFEPFNLRRLVAEVCEALEHTAAAKAIRLSTRYPEGLQPVMGDRERIRQVLVNLVDNAIKYSNEGGDVTVAVTRLPHEEVKIAVVDEGIGVTAQDLPRLTERFYRVDKSRSRDQGGTGLGLAIVKHILNAHGRRLTVESSPGKGSTFGFTLPLATEAAVVQPARTRL